VTFVPMLVQTFCFWGIGLLGGAWLCYRWQPPLGVAGFWLASVISLVLAAGLLLPLLRKAMQRQVLNRRRNYEFWLNPCFVQGCANILGSVTV
jgi:Na+-driven multidrug efflux pump